MFVVHADERRGVLELEENRFVEGDAQRVAVVALELDVIRAALDDRRRAWILRAGEESELLAVLAMLVDAGEDVEPILPAAEDDNVARGVVVRSSRRDAMSVSPGFRLDVALG